MQGPRALDGRAYHVRHRAPLATVRKADLIVVAARRPHRRAGQFRDPHGDPWAPSPRSTACRPAYRKRTASPSRKPDHRAPPAGREPAQRRRGRAKNIPIYTGRRGIRDRPRGLVLDGMGGRSPRRAASAPALARYLRHCPRSRHQCSVRPFLDATDVAHPTLVGTIRALLIPRQPVVGISWYEGNALLRVADQKRKWSLPAPPGGGVGKKLRAAGLDAARFPWGERPSRGDRL